MIKNLNNLVYIYLKLLISCSVYKILLSMGGFLLSKGLICRYVINAVTLWELPITLNKEFSKM